MSELAILGISGSLRKRSFNTALLRAAKELVPEGMSIEIYTGLREIPPYDGDLDTDAPPGPVADLRARIRAADGLLIATPEYNYGVPGVLKNAIDWASRPTKGSSLEKKPIVICGATPGAFGTVRAQTALRPTFLFTDSPVVGKPEVYVAKAAEKFDGDSNLTDGKTREILAELLKSLSALIRKS
jgi:chromate reductase, NAD(P)H dehydrogenase (quinone)